MAPFPAFAEGFGAGILDDFGAAVVPERGSVDVFGGFLRRLLVDGHVEFGEEGLHELEVGGGGVFVGEDVVDLLVGQHFRGLFGVGVFLVLLPDFEVFGGDVGVVFAEALQGFGIVCPVLHQLGGELDEVARTGAGAVEAAVFGVRDELVGGVAEFVEHCLDVFAFDESGPFGFGFFLVSC